MIVHNWGLIAYEQAQERMQVVHLKACEDGQNHLILCSHPNVFTVGSDTKRNFSVDVVQTDRGGSITCHSPGQSIFYFCFDAKSPTRFYKKVLLSFERFFMKYLPEVKYDKQNPGFYIHSCKIASLGFRYSRGVSLHGVALNIAVDLDFHSQVAPCNLTGVLPTSLQNEGVMLTKEQVDAVLVEYIKESFL